MSNHPILKKQWWDSDPSERFWLESTDRLDIGANLKFPQFNEGGKTDWHYSLLLQAQLGDVVVHFKKGVGIVGHSTIAGEAEERTTKWVGRGISSRTHKTAAYDRPGWVIPLEEFVQLDEPIDLNALDRATPALRQIRDHVSKLHPNKTIYFPFELSHNRPNRMLQGYGFKLPREVVELFSILPLIDGYHTHTTYESRSQGFGSSAIINRAIELHAMRTAVEYFLSLGYEVEDTSASNPYDLIITIGGAKKYVEVKGTTSDGERVILTRNEVEHVKSHPGECILFILSKVKVSFDNTVPLVTEGKMTVLTQWTLNEENLEPISFFYHCGTQ